jgi:hypothetical protein
MLKHLSALLLFCLPLQAQLTVNTDFPGGAAEVLTLDAAAGRIEIAPPVHEGRGWPCWWYFRVDGATPGQTLTVVVRPANRPFRAQQRLAASWSMPKQASISSDDITWQSTAPGDISREAASYRVTAPAGRFWLAWGPPFLPSHAETLLAETASRLPEAERFVLATTRGGRPVPGLRFGRRDAAQVVWVQARQHAWETGASWVGRGFLEWVSSDTPAARTLREQVELFFIPIMDVDNVAIGAGGKDAEPRDHNRDWSDQPLYPEVKAAKQRITALIDSGRLTAYFDLHNPSPSNLQSFFFGPLDFEQMTGVRRHNYERFLELAVAEIREPLPITPKYHFATYVKTEEERARVSSNWVRDHAHERTVALSLETAWNTPNSTTEGYRGVGAGLARTLAAYLAETPAR